MYLNHLIWVRNTFFDEYEKVGFLSNFLLIFHTPNIHSRSTLSHRTYITWNILTLETDDQSKLLRSITNVKIIMKKIFVDTTVLLSNLATAFTCFLFPALGDRGSALKKYFLRI